MSSILIRACIGLNMCRWTQNCTLYNTPWTSCKKFATEPIEGTNCWKRTAEKTIPVHVTVLYLFYLLRSRLKMFDHIQINKPTQS